MQSYTTDGGCEGSSSGGGGGGGGGCGNTARPNGDSVQRQQGVMGEVGREGDNGGRRDRVRGEGLGGKGEIPTSSTFTPGTKEGVKEEGRI